MTKYKLFFITFSALIIIFILESCGVTKNITIGYDYPNFVKDDSTEIIVGEKFKFIKDDSYDYIIVIEKANEFLDTDSVNLVVGIGGRNIKSYISDSFLVVRKGSGEYFFRALCRDKNSWSANTSRMIIKSE